MSFAVPEQVAVKFGLQAGDEVADFGAGIGAYTLACARLVGTGGKVYAVDVQKDLLERLRHEARQAGLNNIEFIWGDVETRHGVKLADGSVDVVVMASVFFQLEDKAGAVAEASRILPTGGRVILADWRESAGGIGPKPEDIVAPAKAEELFVAGGFKKIGEFPAGDYQYGLVFRKVT